MRISYHFCGAWFPRLPDLPHPWCDRFGYGVAVFKDGYSLRSLIFESPPVSVPTGSGPGAPPPLPMLILAGLLFRTVCFSTRRGNSSIHGRVNGLMRST